MLELRYNIYFNSFFYYNYFGDNMKILCVGNSAYDITFILPSFPVENYKYKTNEIIKCGGGTCSNSAYLLSKWGLDVYLASVVGNDSYGKLILKELKSVGVNTNYFDLRDNYDTNVSYIIVNKENGSRTIISSNSTNNKIDKDINIDIIPDIILIDGREFEFSKRVIKEYKNAISIIDASNNTSEVRELCKLCDYVVCSKNFMAELSNIDISNLDNLDDAFNILENMFNTRIIVTLEDNGSAYRSDSGNIEVIPSISVRAVDTTGAGDIFHGAFVYGISKEWNIKKILKFSNIAGAISTTKRGGRYSIFDYDEVEKIYNEIK